MAHEVLHTALAPPATLHRAAARAGQRRPHALECLCRCRKASALSHLAWLQLPVGAVLLNTLREATQALAQPVEKSLLEWDVERM